MFKSTLQFEDVELIPGLLTLLRVVQRSCMWSRKWSGRRPGNDVLGPRLPVPEGWTLICYSGGSLTAFSPSSPKRGEESKNGASHEHDVVTMKCSQGQLTSCETCTQSIGVRSNTHPCPVPSAAPSCYALMASPGWWWTTKHDRDAPASPSTSSPSPRCITSLRY